MNRTLNEADDDFELPQRSSDRRTPAREEMYREERTPDRELTLSTGTVLGIFFALALVCAVFFGFGYTMGRKSGQAAADTAAASASGTDTASTDATASKPAAGSPAIQAIPGYLSQHDADTANRSAATQPYKPGAASSSTAKNGTTSVTLPVDGPAVIGTAPVKTATARVDATALPHKNVGTDAVTTIKPLPAVVKPTAASSTSATTAGTSPFTTAAVAGGANGPIYVQIAAVSHKEDADNLLAALKRRGYSAFERNLDTDKLIHVQVGPFNTKQSAETMRGRLLGDSYNAILK